MPPVLSAGGGGRGGGGGEGWAVVSTGGTTATGGSAAGVSEDTNWKQTVEQRKDVKNPEREKERNRKECGEREAGKMSITLTAFSDGRLRG